MSELELNEQLGACIAEMAKCSSAVNALSKRLDYSETELATSIRSLSDQVELLTARLKATEGLADSVKDLSARLANAETQVGQVNARANSQNDIVTDFAKLALDEQRVAIEAQRDRIQAAKEQRAATWSAVGKAATFVFSVAGFGAIGALILKACTPAHAAVLPDVIESVEEGAAASSGADDVLPLDP